MAAFLAPIAGAVVGGLMSDDQQASASREPWAPAQPWLKEQIATGQKLQNYYQENPFSPLQQQAYRNLFSNIDNFSTNVQPSLLNLVGKYLPGGSPLSQSGAGQSQNAAQAGSAQPPQNLSDTQRMVADAYAGVGRTGFGGANNQIDQGGFDYWVKQLDSGAVTPENFGKTFTAAVDADIARNPNGAASQYYMARRPANYGSYGSLLDAAFSPQANPFYVSPEEKLRLEEEKRSRNQDQSFGGLLSIDSNAY